MNADNILALLADLYGQIVALQAENSHLKAALASVQTEAPPAA